MLPRRVSENAVAASSWLGSPALLAVCDSTAKRRLWMCITRVRICVYQSHFGAPLQEPYEPEDEDDYELKPGKGKEDGRQVRAWPPCS